MDENKEKELLENEEENITDKLSDEEKEEVSKILDDLKNSSDDETKPVTDWDGLAKVNVGDDNIVTENEETVSLDENEEAQEAEEKELDEDDLCIKCGKRERYTELDENYLYCKACREEMKKTRMNVWGVLAFIGTVMMGFVAVVFAVWSIGISIPVIKGDMYMKEGKYQSAITCYSEAISSINSLNSEAETSALFDIGNKTYAKIIRAAYKSGSLPTASNILSGQLDCFAALEDSGAFEQNKYSDVKEYNDAYNKMMDTYAYLVQSKYTQALNSVYETRDKNELKDIQKYLDELEEDKQNEDYDKYMVAYVQNLFASMANNTVDERIKYLSEIKDGGRMYEFIYATELCMAYLEKGDYEKAEKECYDSIEVASENLSVYQFLMKSKIRQGDFDGAIKLAEEAEKKSKDIYIGSQATEDDSAVPHTVLMEKAIAYALKGEKEKAIAAIDLSYSIGNDNSNLNVYMLLHYLYHVNGTEPTEDEDGNKIYDSADNGYDQAVLTINTYGAYYGLSISDNIDAIMKGEKTLEDVFVKGEVDW